MSARSSMTRRTFLARGATLGACALTAGVCPALLRSAPAQEADIFSGGAPKGRTWDLWRKRGWAREAAHYVRRDGAAECLLCPNHCILEPGDRGRCRNRVNIGGTLYTLAYANPCALHVDPVEKKPLFHFLPGTRTYSLATAGCVLRCLNCQNWEISQRSPEETKDAAGEELRLTPERPGPRSLDEARRATLMPEDLAAIAAALRCPSVSYTYSEPVAFYEYALDSSRAVRARGLRNILVTSAYIREAPLRELARWTDAAHVDLKGFDEAVYLKLNGGALRPVLDALLTLRRAGVWVEIVNLVVPTYTDRMDAIGRMCDWIAEALGPDVPLHFSRCHPAHKLRLAPTPADTLEAARARAREAGLRYVYIGNVPGLKDAATTFCPRCAKAVVVRDVYSLAAIHLEGSACRFCGATIPGVWRS